MKCWCRQTEGTVPTILSIQHFRITRWPSQNLRQKPKTKNDSPPGALLSSALSLALMMLRYSKGLNRALCLEGSDRSERALERYHGIVCACAPRTFVPILLLRVLSRGAK